MLNNLFLQKISRKLTSFLVMAGVVALAGCGSGGGGGGGTGATSGVAVTTTGQTLTGTVAVGKPLYGATVTIQDSKGVVTTGLTPTLAQVTAATPAGSFSIPVTGMTPPFMLVASLAGTANMYSILPAMDMTKTNTQNVNITQITSLVMYELNTGGDPATMYNQAGFTAFNAAMISAKESVVRSKLPANGINAIFNTMYAKFAAGVYPIGTNPDPYDAALDSLGKIPVGATTDYPATGIALAGLATPYTVGAAVAAGTASVTVTLTDPVTFATRTSVSTGNSALVTATVRDSKGLVVPNAIVTFTTDPIYGSFSGGANTALTNASGIASATLTTANTAGGASTIAANTSVAGTAVSGTQNYAVGASNITLSALTLPATTLSAYGTAGISVQVLNNGAVYTTPMTVNFSSTCASTGKATLTQSVTTVNGVASASYLDNGCNNSVSGDPITASMSNGTSATGNLKVASPTASSIQFVSVSPASITLKGTGGTGLSESSKVTFIVRDQANKPVPNALVSFSLNTNQGGLQLSSLSATSAADGSIGTNVQAGTVSTAVRVTATLGAGATALSTQSDQLVVSTGIPAQDTFSTSATKHNIEGLDFDGETTTITARLADHFHNPVPDGTAVYFTAEGGSVMPNCLTVGGVCSVVLSSQNIRPTNGRVTVLATAVGEEAFLDLNPLNGTVDSATEMVDVNGVSTDMPEAFVDFNENGIRDAGETARDFNHNGLYDLADGLYNGMLCTLGAAICNTTQKSIEVRDSQIIVFSGTTPVATTIGIVPTTTATTTPVLSSAILLTSPSPALCGTTWTTGRFSDAAATIAATATTMPFTVTIIDKNGNAPPVGTTIDFSTTNGTFTTKTKYVVPDTIGCRTGYAGCPASAGSATFGDYKVGLTSDAVITKGNPAAVPPTPDVCTNPINAGTFTITVQTPLQAAKGTSTTFSIPVED